MMVINGQFPGPLIEANEGDTIIINVQNDLSTGQGLRKCFADSLQFNADTIRLLFGSEDWRKYSGLY